MAKDIKIVSVLPNYEEPTEQRMLKTFRSYASVVKSLRVGETVVVQVCEGKTKDFMVFMGYGEVSKTGLSTYTCPKRLLPDY